MKAPPLPKASPKSSVFRKRILIVDDHAILREGLSDTIGRESDLEVCGQTGDAYEAMELAASTEPDLALLDISIGGKNGLELIKDLQAHHPQVAILALSMHEETLYAERVLRAGGRGYIMKQEGGQRVLAAIRQVLAGEIAVSPKVSAKVLNLFSGKSSDISPVERLTDRELQIFHLLGQGKDSHGIGKLLHISPKTAEVHRTHIKEKLQIATNSELICFAARWVETHGPL